MTMSEYFEEDSNQELDEEVVDFRDIGKAICPICDQEIVDDRCGCD